MSENAKVLLISHKYLSQKSQDIKIVLKKRRK